MSPRIASELEQGAELAGAGRGELQHELVDVHPRQVGRQRIVGAFQQRALLPAPVPPADVQPEAHAVHALDHAVEEIDRELQLLGRVLARGQRGAHERQRLALGEDQLGQDRLVELDEVGAGVSQLAALLAQHADDVLAELLLAGVDPAGDLLDPHGARQQVGSGKRDLDRPVRVLAQEPVLVERQRPAARDPAHAGGVLDREGGHVERLQDALEARLVLDDVEHLGEGDQAHALELVGDEGVEVVAALLPVGDDVDAGLLLEVEQAADGLVGDAVEVVAGDHAVLLAALRLEDLGRARPAADGRDREEQRGLHSRSPAAKKSCSRAAAVRSA